MPHANHLACKLVFVHPESTAYHLQLMSSNSISHMNIAKLRMREDGGKKADWAVVQKYTIFTQMHAQNPYVYSLYKMPYAWLCQLSF